MFQQPFNFSFQRTAIQAVGWYLFFCLLSFLFGVFATLAAGTLRGSPLTVPQAIQFGARLAPIVPIVLTVLVLRKRPLTARNVIVAAVALILSFFLGFLGAGVLLAYLTTQPIKETVSSRADIFS